MSQFTRTGISNLIDKNRASAIETTDFGFADSSSDFPAASPLTFNVTTFPPRRDGADGVSVSAGHVATAVHIVSGLPGFTPTKAATELPRGNSRVQWQNGGIADGAMALDSTPQTMSTNVQPAALHDFNSDGSSDIVLQNGGTIVDYLLRNGTLLGGNLLATGLNGYTVVGTGDFNGDGMCDVLLQSGGTIVDYQMSNGELQFGKLVATGLDGYSVVGTGDFNNDGTTDILLQNGGTIVDYLVKDGQVAYGALIATGLTGYRVVGTGDFNGDGTSDVLLQGGGTIVDYQMSNGELQVGKLLGTGFVGQTVVGTGDFNGDGTTDFLTQLYPVVIFRSDTTATAVNDFLVSDGVVQAGNRIVAEDGISVAGTGDFNGDGYGDILLRDGSGTLVSYLFGSNGLQRGQLVTDTGIDGYSIMSK